MNVCGSSIPVECVLPMSLIGELAKGALDINGVTLLHCMQLSELQVEQEDQHANMVLSADCLAGRRYSKCASVHDNPSTTKRHSCKACVQFQIVMQNMSPGLTLHVGVGSVCIPLYQHTFIAAKC